MSHPEFLTPTIGLCNDRSAATPETRRATDEEETELVANICPDYISKHKHYLPKLVMQMGKNERFRRAEHGSATAEPVHAQMALEAK
jgi:hypothetical protein